MYDAHRIFAHAEVFLVADVEHCALIFRLEAIVSAMATSAAPFLFLILIRVVCGRSRIITVVFGTFWVAIAMSSMVLVFPRSVTVSRRLFIHH